MLERLCRCGGSPIAPVPTTGLSPPPIADLRPAANRRRIPGASRRAAQLLEPAWIPPPGTVDCAASIDLLHDHGTPGGHPALRVYGSISRRGPRSGCARSSRGSGYVDPLGRTARARGGALTPAGTRNRRSSRDRERRSNCAFPAELPFDHRRPSAASNAAHRRRIRQEPGTRVYRGAAHVGCAHVAPNKQLPTPPGAIFPCKIGEALMGTRTPDPFLTMTLRAAFADLRLQVFPAHRWFRILAAGRCGSFRGR